ncbi:MAG: hypothetical protein JXR76_12345 [Deltaproteobacteria bacterium]|nr:hypothetical protein [Deltaproteobacteria bacterium]
MTDDIERIVYYILREYYCWIHYAPAGADVCGDTIGAADFGETAAAGVGISVGVCHAVDEFLPSGGKPEISIWGGHFFAGNNFVIPATHHVLPVLR